MLTDTSDSAFTKARAGAYHFFIESNMDTRRHEQGHLPLGFEVPSARTMFEGYRVLVADDDEDFCEAVSNILDDEGFSVIQVTNGVDALHSALHLGVDLVLLDLRMPGMQGLDVYDALLVAGFDKPIILISGMSDMQHTIERHGMHRFLRKPFQADELMYLVRHALAPEPLSSG